MTTELVAITEGFKAASGITAGIVALAGVWNGQVAPYPRFRVDSCTPASHLPDLRFRYSYQARSPTGSHPFG